MARPAYKSYPTPRIVSQGTVSKPRPQPKPRPQQLPNFAIRKV